MENDDVIVFYSKFTLPENLIVPYCAPTFTLQFIVSSLFSLKLTIVLMSCEHLEQEITQKIDLRENLVIFFSSSYFNNCPAIKKTLIEQG